MPLSDDELSKLQGRADAWEFAEEEIAALIAELRAARTFIARVRRLKRRGGPVDLQELIEAVDAYDMDTYAEPQKV